VTKLGNITSLEYVWDKVDGALSFRVKSNEYFIPITGNINVDEEIAKLEAELLYTLGFPNQFKANWRTKNLLQECQKKF
jgi:valyl-tRNA synthetase